MRGFRCTRGTRGITPRTSSKLWRCGRNGRCISDARRLSMRPLHLLGRAIFGGYFLYSGIHHFLDHEMLSQYAGAKGVAAPDAAVATSGAMLVAGGLSIVTGLKPRQGLAAIVGFLIPVSLQM